MERGVLYPNLFIEAIKFAFLLALCRCVQHPKTSSHRRWNNFLQHRMNILKPVYLKIVNEATTSSIWSSFHWSYLQYMHGVMGGGWLVSCVGLKRLWPFVVCGEAVSNTKISKILLPSLVYCFLYIIWIITQLEKSKCLVHHLTWKILIRKLVSGFSL